MKPTVKIKFFSNLEVAGFFISSLMVISILFPMGKIEELIYTAPDFNIELSEIYLQNLIKVNPDVMLKLAIVERYIKTGKMDTAYQVLTSLKNIRNIKVRAQSLALMYEILKWKYNWADTEQQKRQIKRELNRCLSRWIVVNQDPKVLRKIFEELISMEMPDLATKVAKKIFLLKGVKDYKILRKLSYSYLWKGKYKKAISLMEEIIYTCNDLKMKKIVFKEMLRILLWNKDYQDLKEILLKDAPIFSRDEDMTFFCLKIALSTGDPYFTRKLLLRILESI